MTKLCYKPHFFKVKLHVYLFARVLHVYLSFQGDLRRMWSEPFISQQPSKHMDV